MRVVLPRAVWLLSLAVVAFARAQTPQAAGPVLIRVATFNVEDIRTDELKTGTSARLKQLAEVIQRVHPNVLLVNEIAYDMPGGPDVVEGDQPGQNGQRFAELYLGVSQAAGLEPLHMRAFMAPVNTGVPSGLDMDHDGTVTKSFPPVSKSNASAPPPEPDDAGRKYGNDCWGFGTFPGQYGMALLVDERLLIEDAKIRTFRLMPWDYMPGAFLPPASDGTGSWFTDEQKEKVRLSSKSHWDVPVSIPNGAVVHFLCSHPTPPAFDGAEQRNKRRNHDEIRFWADYIEGQSYIVDDADVGGGLARRASFVILGDLNADPAKGNAFKDPIKTVLGSVERLNTDDVPRASVETVQLEPTDTSSFRLRVDYVLPSKDLEVRKSGVWRDAPSLGKGTFPSDHFPVWMDLSVPAPAK